MIRNNYPGKFIVIEGLDGSGHTSQVSLLKNFLIENNYQVITAKDPTQKTEAGRKIRKILKGNIEINPLEFQKLFAKDRKWHLDNKIIPALRKGKIIILDRYCFSSFAYGTADGADLDKLIKINENFLLPDLTFILKVSPQICIGRIEKRGSPKELFERKEQLEKVWKIYEKFPQMFNNVIIIDGEMSIENVFEEIKRSFFKIITLKRKEN